MGLKGEKERTMRRERRKNTQRENDRERKITVLEKLSCSWGSLRAEGKKEKSKVFNLRFNGVCLQFFQLSSLHIRIYMHAL